MTQNSNQKKDEPVSVVRVSGSKGIEDHVVQNIVNNNPATHYSTKGIGSFFDIEYNKEFDFNTLYLILLRGAQRKTTFSVAYTHDFKTFKPTKPATFTSPGNDSYGEYHFHKVKAKGARVSFEGHVANTYSTEEPAKSGGNSGVQSATNPGQSIGQTGDSSANSEYFSVIGAALTNQDLTKEQEKQLKGNTENQEECKDCNCLRCGAKCNDGICENCGIKGHYEHVPLSVVETHHIIDTIPSPSQPAPLVIDENARHSSTVPAGAPAQAGNTVETGIEIDKNIAGAKDNIVDEKAKVPEAKNNTAREVKKVDNTQSTTGNFNNNKDLGPSFHTSDPQAQSNNIGKATKDNNKNENNSNNVTAANNNKKSSNIKEGDTVETQTTIVDKKDTK